MKKVLLTLVCAFALTLGTVFSAQAETTGVYVAPKFLMMWQNNHADYDVSDGTDGENANMFNSQFTLGGALAVGYDFFPQLKLPIRAELEFAMRGVNEGTTDGDGNAEWKSSANASTLMANVFYDFHNDSDFTPYVTAGAGLAFIHVKNEINDNSDSYEKSTHATNFAWNVGAGVAYNFSENLAVDLGYRYVNMGSVNHSVSSGSDKAEFDNRLYNHEIALGVRFTF